jgi:hypothetical protein
MRLMETVLKDAAYYREQARGARERAKAAPMDEMVLWLDIADDYETLAELAERSPPIRRV